MKLIFRVLIFCLLIQSNAIAQLVTKNIKTDFGAVGDGVADDDLAFDSASNYINSVGGNVELVIPFGTYLVGDQNYTPSNPDALYTASPVLKLENCNNVKITGVLSGGVRPTIKLKDGFKFGMFDRTTLNPPMSIDDFNPFVNCVEKYPGVILDFSDKRAEISMFIRTEDCNTLTIENLHFDGNIQGCILGGNWGCGPRPIELKAFGLRMEDTKNVTLSDLSFLEIGADAIFIVNDGPTIKSENYLLQRIEVNGCGRNGISWVGGDNVTMSEVVSKNNGMGLVTTSPAAGLDIEPESLATVTNGVFEDCEFTDNAGNAVACGDPVNAYNLSFTRCLMKGTSSYSMVLYSNRTTLNDCKFFGEVLHYAAANNDADAVKYNDCFFSDCYLGTQMYASVLLALENGTRTQMDGCTFMNFYNPSFYINPVIPSCSTDADKVLIKNSTFVSAVSSNKQYSNFMGIGRRTRWQNNTFYYYPGYPFYTPTSCPPIGEGNTDLGSGLVGIAALSSTNCSAISRAAVNGGIDDLKPMINNNDNKVEIYPNPAGQLVNIVTALPVKQKQVYLYNELGQLLLTQPFNGNRLSMDVSKLVKGIYHVKIQAGEEIIIKKIVKQ